jgi:crotonobetainyl-CoA:carnitine CoA-transferase CaiB-like acyl-CoA transferase
MSADNAHLPKPLAGIRVLDFGHTVMGPCAGLVFADLGADVIKVEPADGDPTRRLPGFGAGFFATYNRNKRSIAVDLKRPEGRVVVHRLAAHADILLENFGPGTMERLGCGYDDLKAVNPRLIYLSLKGFLTGPYQDRGALDEVVQMQSGLAYMTGPPGQPLRAGAPVVDILGGAFGVVAALSALRERDRTGRGQRVASSLFESAAFMLAPLIAGSVVLGEPLPPMPTRKFAWGVYDVFSGSDGGQVFIACTSDGHWRRFCEAFGFDDWRDDPRLSDNARRCEAREWMIPQLQQRLAAYPVGDILATCERAKVAFARVGRPDELPDDPHLGAHGGLIATAMAVIGEGAFARLPALPVEFGESRERPGLTCQPPRLGQHTAEIMHAIGYGEEDIQTLCEAGIVYADA